MRKLYVVFLMAFAMLYTVNKASAQCTPSAVQSFTQNTPVNILDNSVVTSTLNVAGAPNFLYKLTVTTFIQHTFAADLDITITSPTGTVVTLTTDNGGGNDNVFNGTVWDDDANPAGQVPYTSNNGLVGDHTYTNLVTATPLVAEEALGAFIGENPNGTWTITISDDLGGDVGIMTSWTLGIQGLAAAPTLTSASFANNTPVNILDNTTVTSTINIAGAGTQLFDVNLITNITHTFAGDLDITIMSPAGTVVTLTTDNGGGNDNVFAGTTWDDDANPGGVLPYSTNNGLVSDHSYTNLVTATPLTSEEALAAFIGENPNGTWTISISDDAGGDVGILNSWSLNIQTSTCGAPVPCNGSTNTYTQNTPVAIPSGPAVVTSTFTVTGAPAYIYDLDLRTFITHTFNADLDITLTSPAGTVVTLTTDNGGSNDNVFNGTLWDDDANPGGQVPYSSNNGLVTDHSYTNLVTATPLAPEEPLGAFVGENPNGTWTLTISDDLGGDGGNLASWSLIIGAMPFAPVVTPTASFTNNTPVAITDNTVVTSTINVAGAGTQLIDVNLFTNITHTFAADLDITIMSPAGTVVTLTTDNGSSFDDLFAGTLWDDDANPAGQVPYSTNNGMVTDHNYGGNGVVTPLTPEEGLAAFIGEDPNGTWTISISDDLGGDVGTLNSWRLDLRTYTCPPPCAGVPSPGTISGPAAVQCNGNPVTLTLNGYSAATGLTFQWRSSATPGGPYTAIPGANSTAYSFNATTTTYFIVSVTCSNAGGGTANTVEFAVRVSNLVHSNVIATPSTVCSPGATVITGTVSGSAAAGNYTHSLTGPGVIVQNPPSGANNSNFSFSVSAIPAGNQVYTVTSTDPAGCTKVTTVNVTVNATPTVSLSTTPAPASAPCTENFDGVTVPALPAGWSATAGVTCAGTARWATVNTVFDSPPNSAFANDPNCVSDEYLDSRSYTITTAGQITFRRNHSLENNFDGMVLEISINGGPFTDIITAGGSFVTGGYNGTISVSFSSPIAGRQAWTGNSGGWVTTTVNLPASANGQPVVFRFRRATDSSVSSTGVNIDGVIINNTSSCSQLTVCNSTIVRIDAVTQPGFPQTFTQNLNTNIPAGPNTSGNASPYPNTLNISGIPTSGVTVKSVTLGTYYHTFPDDVDVVLVSPGGQAVILMSDVGGATPATGQTFILDDAAANFLADAAFNPSGTYKPTNIGAGDSWPAPGPGSPTATTLSTFTGNMNGNWNLYVVDDASGATGIISTWSLTLNVPPPVVFSPTTELYTDAAATIPYTGQPVYTVWSKQTASGTYTATATQNGCSGVGSITINIDQPPAITSQPSTTTTFPACPGYNIVYTVGATGAGLTYQWQVSTNGGATFTNITPNPTYSGFTTNQLTIINPQPGMTGYQYRVIVSGTCTPSPVTSNAVTITIAQVPTITSVTTNPANASVCVGQNITFTVAFSGTPTPNIFQWQSSPDGVTWTNLTTGGSFTPVFTITGATLAQNGLRYRVIVTNACGQSATSTPVTLTVSTNTVTVTPLPNRICLTDSVIQLQGSPVGGSWSGIGVSGFNFVPTATGIGTYTLTYSYTNPSGCTATATVVAKVEDCPERIRLLRDDAVILFPNPNNGRFNFRMNSTLYNYLNMRVYNSQGQLVNNRYFGGLVYGRVVPVDLHHLPGGVYFVKFAYDDGIRTSEKTFTVVIGR